MKVRRLGVSSAILFAIAMSASSCNLFGIFFDYRNDVCGDYTGFKLYTYYNIDHYEFDTTFNVLAELNKGEADSIVEFVFYWSVDDTTYTSKTYSFDYDGITFQCLTPYTSTSVTLSLDGDALHFSEWPGMAPNTYEVFATKVD